MNGLVLADKKSGCTSSNILIFFQKNILSNSIGFVGTLDPFASGIIVLLFGSYTRYSNMLVDSSKTYNIIFEKNINTISLDRYGKIDKINKKIKSHKYKMNYLYLGLEKQIIPNYSAKKIYGYSRYILSLNNIPIKYGYHHILLYMLKLNKNMKDELFVTLTISKGGYVRGITNEMMNRLGEMNLIYLLNRQTVGYFNLNISMQLCKKNILEYSKNIMK